MANKFEPDTTNVFCPKVPITTVLFANTSKTGKPAIVFTDIKESDRSSDTSNNLPLLPSTENNVVLLILPEPTMLTTLDEPDTCNLAVGDGVPIPTLVPLNTKLFEPAGLFDPSL